MISDRLTAASVFCQKRIAENIIIYASMCGVTAHLVSLISWQNSLVSALCWSCCLAVVKFLTACVVVPRISGTCFGGTAPPFSRVLYMFENSHIWFIFENTHVWFWWTVTFVRYVRYLNHFTNCSFGWFSPDFFSTQFSFVMFFRDMMSLIWTRLKWLTS